MKGLLLKDVYMMAKYCRAYVLITVVFLFVSVMGDNFFFFLFYPCLLAGMIPVTLLGYDERSRWTQYCGTLPYTKAQVVSGKYLIGLLAQLAVIALSALAQALRMHIHGTFGIRSYLVLIALLLASSCFASSVSLPFMFRFGVEKGRIAYYVMIGAVCAGSVIASGLPGRVGTMEAPAGTLPVLFLAALAVYALSWVLSVVFYQKREV